MKRYTVKKFQHHSTPKTWFRARIGARKFSWEAQFTLDSKYLLYNPDGTVSPDQKDWNKLLGVFFHPFDTRHNTMMIGWRYNEYTDLFELNFYTHVDGATDYTEPVTTARVGDLLQVDILVDYRQLKGLICLLVIPKDGTEPDYHSKEVYFKSLSRYSNEISHYFGGNQTAPSDVEVLKT